MNSKNRDETKSRTKAVLQEAGLQVNAEDSAMADDNCKVKTCQCDWEPLQQCAECPRRIYAANVCQKWKKWADRKKRNRRIHSSNLETAADEECFNEDLENSSDGREDQRTDPEWRYESSGYSKNIQEKGGALSSAMSKLTKENGRSIFKLMCLFLCLVLKLSY